MTNNAKSKLAHLKDVRLLTFKRFDDERGMLVPVESGIDVPIQIERFFYVTPNQAGQSRGKHGHFHCTQILIALAGHVTVKVQDNVAIDTYELTEPNQALMIPPSLWAEEIYNSSDSLLLVLCDHKFDADDYINCFDDFLAFRGMK